MMRVLILKSCACRGQSLPAGEHVELDDEHARVLIRMRRAVEGKEEPPKRRARSSKQAPADEPQPVEMDV